MPSLLHITVDSVVIMDGVLGDYTDSPPPILTDHLKANLHPVPGIKAVMLEIADLATLEARGTIRNLTATLTTRADGYTLTTTYH